MPGESRQVLEVWSQDGKVLEGVFEVFEQEPADRFVAALADQGVRAKLLALSVRGIASRAEQVAAAWAGTAFPPLWYVVVQSGSNVALGVYGAALQAEAVALAERLSVEMGASIEVRSWVHPMRPVVGADYRGVEATP